MANESVTDRVNCALAALRSELTELRHQDVELMKQLINITTSIEQMTTQQRYTKRNKRLQKEVVRSASLYNINEDVVSSSSESEYDSDTASDEDIFRANVKLWKCSRSNTSQ